MTFDVFRRIDAPAGQRNLTPTIPATWQTWSNEFTRFLVEAAPELQRLADPPRVRIRDLADYDTTFSRSPAELADIVLQRRLYAFARSLGATRPRRTLMLFDGLLEPHLNGAQLGALFALLRGALVEIAGDPQAAMYTPLGRTGRHVRDFPLHADLYIPEILFNVFDRVPTDESGASLFLPVSGLGPLLRDAASLPPAIGKQILGILTREQARDRFHVLYDLLHGLYPWVPGLEQAMTCRQVRIKLHAGQGYLLHDRAWLHGRETPRGGVPTNRVHRLVFTASGRRRGSSRRDTSSAPVPHAQGRKMPV
jgi:hypothetical protein